MILKTHNQPNITMYIQNRRDRSKFKGCSPLQFRYLSGCNLTGNRQQSATFHTVTVIGHSNGRNREIKSK